MHVIDQIVVTPQGCVKGQCANPAEHCAWSANNRG